MGTQVPTTGASGDTGLRLGGVAAGAGAGGSCVLGTVAGGAGLTSGKYRSRKEPEQLTLKAALTTSVRNR